MKFINFNMEIYVDFKHELTAKNPDEFQALINGFPAGFKKKNANFWLKTTNLHLDFNGDFDCDIERISK